MNEKYQSEHLFLLIGTNPLPNYVAARLLLKPGGQLYLVHTDETSKIAEHLITALGLESGRATKIKVEEAEGNDIFTKVAYAAEGKQSVGLNYTGGTKTMAVHAYRAVEQQCQEAVFSYLDARTLRLFMESRMLMPNSISIPVSRECTFSLTELLGLHGYQLKPVRKDRVQLDLCKALVEVHVNPQAFQQWREWLEKSSLSLADLSQSPYLAAVKQELSKLGDDPGSIAQALNPLNPRWRSLEQCRKWFSGDWLEEYTLWACLKAKSDDPSLFDDYGIDLQPTGLQGGRSFQFDVAAMRGYQLFAISCIATDKKAKAKEHLFEVYVRARQMGGDEARVGLVCCAPENNPGSNPAAIQKEIEESWHSEGRVRVFGAGHLTDLPTYLRDWFNSQP